MKLPPIYNKRSPKQWEIISKHVDFKGKSVLDLGCGYGDLLFRCFGAGAFSVYGIDGNPDTYEELYDRKSKIANRDISLLVHCERIEDFIKFPPPSPFDVIICFSVLPYLRNEDSVIRWIKHHSKISLIECQYAGDGYGFKQIENDDDMKVWLSHFEWESIEPIGKTFIKDRQKYRTIWLCQ